VTDIPLLESEEYGYQVEPAFAPDNRVRLANIQSSGRATLVGDKNRK